MGDIFVQTRMNYISKVFFMFCSEICQMFCLLYAQFYPHFIKFREKCFIKDNDR
jgi:hypothetical protein